LIPLRQRCRNPGARRGRFECRLHGAWERRRKPRNRRPPAEGTRAEDGAWKALQSLRGCAAGLEGYACEEAGGGLLPLIVGADSRDLERNGIRFDVRNVERNTVFADTPRHYLELNTLAHGSTPLACFF
jgi:hypothetical protein